MTNEESWRMSVSQRRPNEICVVSHLIRKINIWIGLRMRSSRKGQQRDNEVSMGSSK